MFMIIGSAQPEGVDPNDNKYINMVKDYANVDLKMEMPISSDYQTRFDLMLASGELPDIVYNHYNLKADDAGDQGAFIDLKKYYDNSPIVQQVVPPELFEMAKSKSGHYYRLPMAWDKGDYGMGTIVRYDLLEKYNGGKWPESVDEWVNVLRAIKKAEPDSSPLSGYGGVSFELSTVFSWFGVMPTGTRVAGGKIVADFTLPEYRAAVELLRQLYSEGILDREFATKTYDDYILDRDNKDVLFWFQTTNTAVPLAVRYKTEHSDYKLAIMPPLTTYPSVLQDPKFAQPQITKPILGYGSYISASSKNPDAAWKTLEGFAQEQLWDAMFWGEEGKQYNVVDGQKVPIADAITSDDFTWGQDYAILYGYNSGMEISNALAKQTLGDDYSKLLLDSLDANLKNAEDHGIEYGYFDDAPLPDDLQKKMTNDWNPFIQNAITEAIMGKISMEEFDQRVAEFKKTYDPVYEIKTQWINDNKDQLRSWGVKEVDW